MNYAGMGEVAASDTVKVGELAKTDPILSGASVLASNVMLYLAKRPKSERRNLLRIKLNGLYPGMGDETVAKLDQLVRRGKPVDQALFDAVRLTLANRIFDWAGKSASGGGMSGLGSLGNFARDAQTFACTGASLSATSGGWTGAFRPGADTAIIGGANAGAMIANCDLDRVRLQGQIANQQAAIAIQQAQVGQQSYGLQTNRMILMAGAGIAGIIAVVAAVKLLK